MTREEQIVEAGKTAAGGKEFSVLVNKQRRTMSAYEIGFIEGAEWADSHPAWVSVEERLPKITIDGWRSEDVFFATDDSKSHFGFYSNKGVWFSSVYGFNGHQATHWMPLPQPPVKKGGQDAS